MKRLLTAVCILLSTIGYSQTNIDADLFVKDSSEFYVPNYHTLYPGDIVILGITFTYTFPDDMDNPFNICMTDNLLNCQHVLFTGTVEDWANIGFYLKFPLPNLPPNTTGPASSQYAHPITLNGVSKSGVRINPPASIADPRNYFKPEEITYYNYQGTQIERPQTGFYLWKTTSGLSGKGFITE
jgi:hypothetical protein